MCLLLVANYRLWVQTRSLTNLDTRRSGDRRRIDIIPTTRRSRIGIVNCEFVSSSAPNQELSKVPSRREVHVHTQASSGTIGHRTSVGNRSANQIAGKRISQSHLVGRANIDRHRASKDIGDIANAGNDEETLANWKSGEMCNGRSVDIIPT